MPTIYPPALMRVRKPPWEKGAQLKCGPLRVENSAFARPGTIKAPWVSPFTSKPRTHGSCFSCSQTALVVYVCRGAILRQSFPLLPHLAILLRSREAGARGSDVLLGTSLPVGQSRDGAAPGPSSVRRDGSAGGLSRECGRPVCARGSVFPRRGRFCPGSSSGVQVFEPRRATFFFLSQETELSICQHKLCILEYRRLSAVTNQTCFLLSDVRAEFALLERDL